MQADDESCTCGGTLGNDPEDWLLRRKAVRGR